MDTHAQVSGGDTVKSWFVPSNVRLHYGGNTGMFSLGPAWSFFKNSATLEYSLGFVPKLDAEQAIYIMALKGIYRPAQHINLRKVRIYPLSLGLTSTYTFGQRFSKYQDTGKYPRDYYWWNTAFRYGLLYQAELYARISHRNISGISLYFEVSVWDIDAYSYFDNANASYLTIGDLTTLGMGARLFL